MAVVGTASTWLPWLRYDDRPIFSFYAVAILPFMVLALTLVIGKLIGRSREPSPRRTSGWSSPASFVVLALLELRVVLADLDRPAAHPLGVAGPDLVPPLDLTPPPRL